MISVGEASVGTAAFDGQTFTCVSAGDFIVRAVAVVIIASELTTSVSGGPATVRQIRVQTAGATSRRIRGTCIGPDSTVDPTPDPTETVATPDPTVEPTPTPTPTPPPIAATLAPGFDPCHINPNEEAIGCLPHYDVTSASSRVRITPDRRLMYEGTREFGGPIPTNPEYPIEYWLVLEGNGQRMEFLLEGGPGQPLTCTRTVNGAPSALGPGEACGELIAPNTLRFAGDITAFAPGGAGSDLLHIGDRRGRHRARRLPRERRRGGLGAVGAGVAPELVRPVAPVRSVATHPVGGGHERLRHLGRAAGDLREGGVVVD